VGMLTRRERSGDLTTMFGRMDRLFDEWMRSLPMRRPFGPGGDWPGEELIRVDEFRDGDTHVVRAELAGIDPDKDVEITVKDGMLQINADGGSRRTPRTRATRVMSCATAVSAAPSDCRTAPPSSTSRPPTRTGSWRSASR
jgi:HSP20 family molecular chaperone IbpA